MSVKPGYGGQEFKDEILDKIVSFKKIVSKDLIISIDGGINNRNINLCKNAGCNMVVSGSYITNSNDYNKQINELK